MALSTCDLILRSLILASVRKGHVSELPWSRFPLEWLSPLHEQIQVDSPDKQHSPKSAHHRISLLLQSFERSMMREIEIRRSGKAPQSIVIPPESSDRGAIDWVFSHWNPELEQNYQQEPILRESLLLFEEEAIYWPEPPRTPLLQFRVDVSDHIEK